VSRDFLDFSLWVFEVLLLCLMGTKFQVATSTRIWKPDPDLSIHYTTFRGLRWRL